MKKIGAVSMVKNESDIIELFLRINLRSIDNLFLIDHCSQDGTLEIALAMQKLYPQIQIFKNTSNDFNQSDAIISVVRSVASQNILDFIIPLDADEFLSCDYKNVDIRKVISDSLDVTEAGLIPWETFCPISLEYFSVESPLYSCFRKRSKEPRQFFKVILGNEYAKDCVVAKGNHSAISQKYSVPKKLMPLKIQHAPVRSPQQIIRKALMGSYALSLKKNRLTGEGYHWDEIANLIRKNNYNIDLIQLSDIALKYAADNNSDAIIDYNSCGIGTDKDKITFNDLAHPNLVRDFDLLGLNLMKRFLD